MCGRRSNEIKIKIVLHVQQREIAHTCEEEEEEAFLCFLKGL